MTEAPSKPVHRSNKVRNIIIGVLVLIVGILLYGDNLQGDTKKYFFYLIFFLVLAYAIWKIFFDKGKHIDVYAIAGKITRVEFAKTGTTLSLGDMQVDSLDAENLVFNFTTSSQMLSFKYNIKGKYVFGRREKKIDGILDEVDKRELMKKMSIEASQKAEIKKKHNLDGYETEEDN